MKSLFQMMSNAHARYTVAALLTTAAIGWTLLSSSNAAPPKAIAEAEVTPEIQLCQGCGPACGGAGYGASGNSVPSEPTQCPDGFRALRGIDCGQPGCGEPDWSNQRKVPWQEYGVGEYVGPPRCAHVPEYRLRVDDLIDCVFRAARNEVSRPYQLEVGDSLKIESVNNPEINREVVVQPDGTITLLLLPTVRAAKRTIPELTADIERSYATVLKRPTLTVTPLKSNTRLTDLLDSVNNRFFSGGLGRQVKVMPDGTIYLPAIGGVPAQGLTLNELQSEINQRYSTLVDGVEVTPILHTRADRFVYVTGEVRLPGRYALLQPTTSLMALSLAGGSTLGGNLREIVVFRRTADWRLMATRLDLNGATLGKRPCPADEIWIRDSDIVLVPKNPLLRADSVINLVFTQGLFQVIPANAIYAQKNVFTGAAAASGT